ncbi:MAG: RNA-binding domain-containing protein [Methanotrichaceae archaeon]
MIEISVQALVKLTEDPEKVTRAIENLFPGLALETKENRITGSGGLESLRNFHRLLRVQCILDTARQMMLQGQVGDTVQFRLNKQAATAEKVNFPPEEESLGSIHVQIKGHKMLIDWLAPQTAEGKPIKEIEL